VSTYFSANNISRLLLIVSSAYVNMYSLWVSLLPLDQGCEFPGNLIHKSLLANPGTRSTLDLDRVPTRYGALAKLGPHLIPWLLHSPICLYLHDLSADLLCWRQCCQKLWASGVNERMHLCTHISQDQRQAADDSEQTLSRAVQAIYYHPVISTKCRPKGLFTQDALRCLVVPHCADQYVVSFLPQRTATRRMMLKSNAQPTRWSAFIFICEGALLEKQHTPVKHSRCTMRTTKNLILTIFGAPGEVHHPV